MELEAGELAQHNFVKSYVLDPLRRKMVVNFINHAVMDLHSRFSLRHEFIGLNLVDGLDTYTLEQRYAEFGSNYLNTPVPTPSMLPYPINFDKKNDNVLATMLYLKDSINRPFFDSFIKLENAWLDKNFTGSVTAQDVSKYGNTLYSQNEIPINHRGSEFSLITNTYNSLTLINADLKKIKTNNKDVDIVLRYQAKLPELDINHTDDAIFDMPDFFLEHISVYVAFRILSTMTRNKSFSDAETLKARYEDLCKRIKIEGLVRGETQETTLFEDKGWV